MTKSFTLALTALTVFAFACEDAESLPLHESLADTKWEVIGYEGLEQTSFQNSPVRYTMEFVTDTTFILHLDVNKVVATYSHAADGKFEVIDAKQTKVCCDGSFALQMAEIVRSSHSVLAQDDRISLVGNGYVQLRRL